MCAAFFNKFINTLNVEYNLSLRLVDRRILNSKITII
jgi:hypothetical protein